MNSKPVVLVLADISGYTKYVRQHPIGVEHADDIVGTLLEGLLDRATNPLIAQKLEGDAAFFYCDDSDGAALSVRRQVAVFHSGFRNDLNNLTIVRSGCSCPACCQAGELRLKVIAHAGRATFRRIRQFDELAGLDVILAHRLLKNSIAADEYSLWTKPFVQRAGEETMGSIQWRTELTEGIGEMRVAVEFPPLADSAWIAPPVGCDG